MRDKFINVLKSYATDERLFLLTGDLGYGILEPLGNSLGNKFCNAGIAEQNMVGVSAALASEGFLPFVYSISPFIYARAFEQVRNDICFHNLPVCLVGSGAGFGYGTAGSTHHALEDCAITSTLPNMTVYVPCFNTDLISIIKWQFNEPSPIYIRLARHESNSNEFAEYLPYRKILNGNSDIIITMGSITGAYYDYFVNLPIEKRPTLWCCAKLPIIENEIPLDLISDIENSHNLCIVEDHIKEGGFAEQFLYFCVVKGIRIKRFMHFCATSSYSKNYGTQDYLRQQNILLPQQVEECLINVHK